MTSIFLIIIIIIALLFVGFFFFSKMRKKEKKGKEEVFEDIPMDIGQEMTDEPLEPLGSTIIDKEFEGLPSADANLQAPNLTEEVPQESIKPVFNLNIDTPISAQEKGTMEIEEKKEEKNTNLDEYKECPVCHTKVDPNATVCFLCGAKLK